MGSLDLIDRGKPTQNCFIESFNGRVREECLNLHWFTDLADARRIVTAWMREYNEDRGHSSLRKKTPRRFATEWRSAMETAENAKSAFPALPRERKSNGQVAIEKIDLVDQAIIEDTVGRHAA